MRTWEENKSVLNQLWPTWQVTAEERKLWHDDLSPLNQDVLYDAIRNTKRTHDAPWPQLKWVLDCYRDLDFARKQLTRTYVRSEPKLKVEVDEARDRRWVEDFMAYIDGAEPSEFESINQKILDKAVEVPMHATSYLKLITYARQRFFPGRTGLSRVSRGGDLIPMHIVATP